MDLSLTEEQQAFRDLARDFLEREAVPHRMRWDHDESVDLAIVPKMAELGFFGLTIPEEHRAFLAEHRYCEFNVDKAPGKCFIDEAREP